ncbi:hypothetical protein BKA65DRAFT_484045 [Rhexocercosporidium sp. MPI-PUGE-AT-0058]|nr:hypothetical protein BKA65DRAFT_484045 [Rhexocercosporidium sp. MPI-PUGE-AT-0058]
MSGNRICHFIDHDGNVATLLENLEYLQDDVLHRLRKENTQLKLENARLMSEIPKFKKDEQYWRRLENYSAPEMAFTCFMTFPKELRLLIWQESLSVEEVIVTGLCRKEKRDQVLSYQDTVWYEIDFEVGVLRTKRLSSLEIKNLAVWLKYCDYALNSTERQFEFYRIGEKNVQSYVIIEASDQWQRGRPVESIDPRHSPNHYIQMERYANSDNINSLTWDIVRNRATS